MSRHVSPPHFKKFCSPGGGLHTAPRVLLDSAGIRWNPADLSPGLSWCDKGQIGIFCLAESGILGRSPRNSVIFFRWTSPAESNRISTGHESWRAHRNPPDSIHWTQSTGIHWTQSTRIHWTQSTGIHWTPLDSVHWNPLDSVHWNPLESTGLSPPESGGLIAN